MRTYTFMFGQLSSHILTGQTCKQSYISIYMNRQVGKHILLCHWQQERCKHMNTQLHTTACIHTHKCTQIDANLSFAPLRRTPSKRKWSGKWHWAIFDTMSLPSWQCMRVRVCVWCMMTVYHNLLWYVLLVWTKRQISLMKVSALLWLGQAKSRKAIGSC